jgi:hypothetical protein
MKTKVLLLATLLAVACDEDELIDHFPGEWTYSNVAAGVTADFSLTLGEDGYEVMQPMFNGLPCHSATITQGVKAKSIKQVRMIVNSSPAKALGFLNLKMSSDHKTLSSDTVVYFDNWPDYTLYFNQVLTRAN